MSENPHGSRDRAPRSHAGGGFRTAPLHGARSLLSTLAAAVEFLTPVRLRHSAALDPTVIGRSPAFFPTVGLALGLILFGIDQTASRILPVAPASAVLVVVLVVLSGGLHLDGLADSADGLFGGRTRERRLEIMRDSRIGSFGALALGLVLLLQWSALVSLRAPYRAGALLIFPALGRSVMVAAIAGFPYARSEGLGVAFRRGVWPWPAPVALVSAIAFGILLFGAGGVILCVVAMLFALGAGAAIARRLGGLTGDTYGALGEVTQVLVLLLIVSGQERGWLQPWLLRG